MLVHMKDFHSLPRERNPVEMLKSDLEVICGKSTVKYCKLHLNTSGCNAFMFNYSICWLIDCLSARRLVL